MRRKIIDLAKKQQHLRKNCEFIENLNAKFDGNFEIRERCKSVHCVDVGETFPTCIFLQNLVSIQLKTSPETAKFVFTITQRFNFRMVFSPGCDRLTKIKSQIVIYWKKKSAGCSRRYIAWRRCLDEAGGSCTEDEQRIPSPPPLWQCIGKLRLSPS